MKIVALGPSGGREEIQSQQLPEDPFVSLAGYGEVLRIPPYSLEQLVFLAETHPVHAAALEQKASDIVASGPLFIPLPEAESADVAQMKRMEAWFQSLFEEYTPVEALLALQLDYETTGWGMLEVARDSRGRVARLFHVPAHTVRAHSDGKRFAQIRQGRRVWFKRWGVEEDYYASTGQQIHQEVDPKRRANELLVFRKPSRRSTWYGIPAYVSAIGWIVLGTTARDYNILFFENSREPRHIFFLMGLDEDVEDVLSDLETQLRTQHREPHRNLLVPLTGDARVEVQRIGQVQNDMHFARLVERTDDEILISHRVPPDRLGMVRRGFLGGSIANVMNRIYRDSIVSRGQDILEDRLNKFVRIEYPRATGDSELQWQIDFEDLDITDEEVDVGITINMVKANLITLNEGRQRLGLPARDALNDMTLAEFVASLGQSPAQAMAEASPSRDGWRQELAARLETIDDILDEILLRTPEAAEEG